MAEYHECMESYRNTYRLIWQAGAVFAAISAGIVAVAVRGGDSFFETPLVLQFLAPLPVLFWAFGIFWPMNRYAEWKSSRLAHLETILSDAVPGLRMEHFRYFDEQRKGSRDEQSSPGGRLRSRTRRWKVGQFRVSEVVALFTASLVGAEIALLIKHLS